MDMSVHVPQRLLDFKYSAPAAAGFSRLPAVQSSLLASNAIADNEKQWSCLGNHFTDVHSKLQSYYI